MKPLNVLSVFEKRTPVLGFSRGQASFDFCEQRNFYQDSIMRSFANSPPLAIWNLASVHHDEAVAILDGILHVMGDHHGGQVVFLHDLG